MFTRYHLVLNDQRTTVSIHEALSDLMAVKLGEEPKTEKAHRAVQQKLQKLMKPFCLSHAKGFYKPSWSVTEQVILDLVDTILSERYWELRLKHRWGLD
jgi:hypothetical protein